MSPLERPPKSNLYLSFVEACFNKATAIATLEKIKPNANPIIATISTTINIPPALFVTGCGSSLKFVYTYVPRIDNIQTYIFRIIRKNSLLAATLQNAY